jgi:hypothetical protein
MLGNSTSHAVALSAIFLSAAVMRRRLGRLPEWPKGAVCKTVGSAYDGSNPSPATTSGNGPLAGIPRLGGPFCCVPPCVSVCRCRAACGGSYGRMADEIRAGRAVGVTAGFPRTATDGRRLGRFRLTGEAESGVHGRCACRRHRGPFPGRGRRGRRGIMGGTGVRDSVGGTGERSSLDGRIPSGSAIGVTACDVGVGWSWGNRCFRHGARCARVNVGSRLWLTLTKSRAAMRGSFPGRR